MGRAAVARRSTADRPARSSAGDPDALDEFAAACGDTVRVRRVAIDYAAHTPHIEALREELLEALDGLQPHAAEVTFCSSLAGGPIDVTRLTGDYWFTGLRQPVLFRQAVESLAASGVAESRRPEDGSGVTVVRRAGDGSGVPVFLEVSPHPVLTGHVEDTLAAVGASAVRLGRCGVATAGLFVCSRPPPRLGCSGWT